MARELGRALAHRLVPPPWDAAGLAEAASLALLSLLPTWLPPADEGMAAALRQLVRQDGFAAFVLAPPATAGGDPHGEALRRYLGLTFAEPLRPPLLLFSEGCREVLRGLPAGPVPTSAPVPPLQAQASARAAAADRPAVGAPAGGIGLMVSVSFAALACFAMGWLGYQLVASLRPSQPTPAARDLLPPSPALGPADPAVRSAGAGVQPSPDRPLRDGGLPGAAPSGSLASLQCLAGGRAEVAAPADPSNYGPRLAQDWQGRAVPHSPELIVLHETVVDEAAALNLFRRHNSEDGEQASYHVLIGRDGRRLRVVDDAQRAFGAGDSAFEGRSVQLKAGIRPSINNIALHVSLVSPDDGADGEAQGHAGYTAEQYRSLASQIAQWQARWDIPGSRVVTHQEVDSSGSRRDPRSFDWRALGRDLRQQWLACGLASPLADLRR